MSSSKRRKLKYLDDLRCLEARASQPTLRVIDGTRQLGRIKHNILAAGPEFPIPELASEGTAAAPLVDSQLGTVLSRGPP